MLLKLFHSNLREFSLVVSNDKNVASALVVICSHLTEVGGR